MNSEEKGLGVYLVRAHCATYNHSMYITDALNGFVLQETKFPYVCSIIDDASTDGEQEVIKEYLQEFFDLQDSSVAYDRDTDYGHVTFAQHKTNKNCYFAVIYLKENHYSQRKSKTPYLKEWMDTKYIALCEGDDYWTDPLKLQKQVDYMEEHEDCCMCCHATDWETGGNTYKNGCQHANSCDLSTDEVIRNNGLYIATNSIVYRSWLYNVRPEWRVKAAVGDFPLQILGSLRGKLHFLSDCMSVYRYLHSGSWTEQQLASNISQEKRLSHAQNKLLWMGLLDKDTDYRYTKVIHSCLFSEYRVLYKSGKIGFKDYFLAVKRGDEKHYTRVVKDFLIRNGKHVYNVWKLLLRRDNG